MRHFAPRRLTTRLILSHLLVGMVSIGLITLLSYNTILQGGRREIENKLTDLALNISNSLESPFLNLPAQSDLVPAIRQTIDPFISEQSLIQYVVFARNGTVLAASERSPSPTRLAQIHPQINITLQGRRYQFSSVDLQQGDVFYSIVPISHVDVIYGALLLTVPYEPHLENTRRSLISMLIISWLILVAVGLTAYLIAQSFSRPIRNLTKMAERMSRGDFQARAELTGPAELIQLAASFNRMAGQLQDNLDGMRAFVANASHELRTPLTAMRLNTDALLTGAIDDPQVSHRFLTQLEDEIDLMTRTVNDLLDLSQIEATRNTLKQEEIDLNALVAETIQFWRNRAQQANLALRFSGPDTPVLINGSEDQLHRLLNNLLDNAIKNTEPGGWVEINLYVLNSSQVRLEVADNGRGIAPEHLPRLFERFYRIESPSPQSKTTGTGLGLAIVKSIVEAHQARLGVNSIVNKGTTFWVEFQAVPQPKPPRKS